MTGLRKVRTLVIVTIILSSTPLFSACSTLPPLPGINTGGSSAVPDQNNPTAAAQSGNYVKFKTMSVVDSQGIGTEAFSLLMPVDWQFDGGIRWVLDNPMMPATSSFRISNPKTKEEFSLFPNQAFFTTDNQLIQQVNPVGSKYFGCEVRPMASAARALKEIVIPRFRPGVTELKIINEGAVDDKSGNAQPGPLKTSHEVAKIRVEYKEGGTTYEDEIYAAVEATY
jgi:hypothetical protein